MGFKFNPLTGNFDISGTSTAAVASQVSNYTKVFNATSDWNGPISGNYKLTILKSSHQKTAPVVQVYEQNGIEFVLVETGMRLDSSDNIIVTVSSSPDLRFVGKIIIS